MQFETPFHGISYPWGLYAWNVIPYNAPQVASALNCTAMQIVGQQCHEDTARISHLFCFRLGYVKCQSKGRSSIEQY